MAIRLYRYIAGILKNMASPAIKIGGYADHVHVLFLLSRNVAIKELVRETKSRSSLWMKTISPRLRRFKWQSGYGIFSVSESNVREVTQYIAHQKEHHRQMSYQEEFRSLCRKHGIPLDERYAWD